MKKPRIFKAADWWCVVLPSAVADSVVFCNSFRDSLEAVKLWYATACTDRIWA